MKLAAARALALALPDTSEEAHHGFPSFRVRGKIFATVPDERTVRVFVDEEQIHAAVAMYPASCSLGYWGQALRAVVVDIGHIEPSVLGELLTDAWRKRAPAVLRKRLAESEAPPKKAPAARAKKKPARAAR